MSRTTLKADKVEELPKAASHIAGFDEMLFGGLPEGRTTLLEGGAGSGKSIFGLEFLYRGALAGQAGIFVAFEEQASAVRRNARTLGWNLEALEEAGKLSIIEARPDLSTVVSGDFSIRALLAAIEGQSKAMGARRIVFDALDVLMRLYDSPDRERQEISSLHEWLLGYGMTAILTVKAFRDTSAAGRYEFLEYMADCVISLVQRPGEWISTRELQIIKYRGSDFGRNAYPFVIQPGGIRIIPISMFGLQHLPPGPHMASGIAGLDKILGGGYRKGSSILLTGASGTGKTTWASSFVEAACARGEKALYVGFEESGEAMVQTMLSPGIDLRPAIRAGQLTFITAMPEALGTEQHLVRTFDNMDRLKPDHVVVDAISSFERMGTPRAAFEFAMRLVNRCKDRGITTMLANQRAGGTDDHLSISGLGISSVIDAILWLRYVEAGDTIKRNLLVVKARGSKHSSQYREFRITDRGIKLVNTSPSDRPARGGRGK